ncbi:MAG: hypothetical protein WDM86_07130 [Rhizomicrobium sp.]
MRSALSILFAAALAASFVGASAQTESTVSPATPPAPAATAPATPEPASVTDTNDVVSCRYEQTTGSLLSKRICHTQREWKQMREDARELMDNVSSRTANPPTH